MIVQSCENCWFNGLQYGSLGLSVGYCTLHNKILSSSYSITCASHQRKDLTLKRVQQVSEQHSRFYSSPNIIRLSDMQPAAREISESDKDLDYLRKDKVGELVADYGALNTTIESLARLKDVSGARAELARLSLSRCYVQNCINRNGKWTSGLHLYWWTKSKLHEMPDIDIKDLRSTTDLSLDRTVILNQWSIIMLRLLFIEDIAAYAVGDPLASAQGIIDKAAMNVPDFNVKKLLSWLKRDAVPALDKYLDRKRYAELANQLRFDKVILHEKNG